ncbi:MAG TPA: RNA polymerase sigma-70 factor [Gemmatimonadales bacterium]|nr:RNA polymerase sigma-70 factor [Gemmatimonadales bacterium]
MLPQPAPGEPPRTDADERWLAFEAFVREQHPALCAYAYRYVREREVAEEVVQEVLFRVWCRRDRMAQVDLVPYVYRSVAHAAISRLRSERAVRNRDLRLQGLTALRADPEPTDGSVRELEDQVRRAIDDLPERTRMVFLLSRDVGLTYAAIAQRMGISTKTVENQMVRALRLLRAALGPHLTVLLSLAQTVQLLRKIF